MFVALAEAVAVAALTAETVKEYDPPTVRPAAATLKVHDVDDAPTTVQTAFAPL